MILGVTENLVEILSAHFERMKTAKDSLFFVELEQFNFHRSLS